MKTGEVQTSHCIAKSLSVEVAAGCCKIVFGFFKPMLTEDFRRINVSYTHATRIPSFSISCQIGNSLCMPFSHSSIEWITGSNNTSNCLPIRDRSLMT